MAIADGTMEKRDCLPSLLEQKHISLFYCNSRKAILNPHQHGSETKFRIKFLHALLFSKSGQFASAKTNLCLALRGKSRGLVYVYCAELALVVLEVLLQ